MAPNGVDRSRRADAAGEHSASEPGGYRKVTIGWWERVFEFTVLAKSNREANVWCGDFHRMMILYGGPLQSFRPRWSTSGSWAEGRPESTGVRPGAGSAVAAV
jgi:hypothetical protein